MRGNPKWGSRNLYGCIRHRGATQMAHRVAWELAHGVVPDGVVIHTCDVPTCVNPEHLALGTHQDNTSDMLMKGRHWAPRGSAQPNSKLTEAEVLAIRADHARGVSQKDLAARHGVGLMCISRIVRREYWRHV